MTYEIIASGSNGNCTILNNDLAVDMGISFKKLTPYYKNLNIVLLTHIHSDHFRKTTIKKLAAERPALRFGCPVWLFEELLNCEVNKTNIDVYQMNGVYEYANYTIIPVRLKHNVPNCGYKIRFSNNEKIIYATDTSSLEGIVAKNYDLYFIEANYEDTEIRERILDKQSKGQFIYENSVPINHLSLKKCNDWLYENMGSNSRYIYMHQHDN